ncbi:methyl-accepting chemotaxis protein [Terribacillus halophilus]|uniref:Methyl-accepting chemotaxis protein n=1 Tax=Terribacillus halophilus TaxID=361279 RepID=A0A1G6TTC0_9BACI|nr:methyl-accepting chemotaxis protein [Terribacillus halophilus]SDD32353.1 methyl-accepting chemotaxis protein [Terribacillus halophilus]
MYEGIVNHFNQTAEAIRTVNANSKTISNQIQDLTSQVEDFAASTEELSAAGQEQLASTEITANSAKDLDGLAIQLNEQLNKFRIK